MKATETNLDLSLKATRHIAFSLLTGEVCSWNSHFPPSLSIPHNCLQSTAITGALNIWALRLTLWKVMTQFFGLLWIRIEGEYSTEDSTQKASIPWSHLSMADKP